MIIFTTVCALVMLFFIFQFLKGKSKTNTPVRADLLEARVPFYRELEPAEKDRFLRLIQEFQEQVHMEGIGTEITELDRTLIAASAIIPVFGFGGWKYKNLSNVILYPDAFNEGFDFEGNKRSILGMVGGGFMNGQMVLSRPALYQGFSNTPGKNNVGIHEFVHLLDKSDGETDGVPEILLSNAYAAPWLKMIHQEMARIRSGKSDIDPYALTNEAEFLAVAAEYFFSKPERFKEEHPALFEEMSRMFRMEQ